MQASSPPRSSNLVKLLPGISTRMDQAGPKDSRTFLGIISETRCPTQERRADPSSHKGLNTRAPTTGALVAKT